MIFTNLRKVSAHEGHLDDEFFYGITAAKKHYDTTLEQISDYFF